jgi:predicted metalloprotease
VVVIFASYYGVDLTGLITGEPVDNSSQQRSISPQEDEAAKFTSVIFATTEDTWGQLFEKWGAITSSPNW